MGMGTDTGMGMDTAMGMGVGKSMSMGNGMLSRGGTAAKCIETIRERGAVTELPPPASRLAILPLAVWGHWQRCFSLRMLSLETRIAGK